MIKTPKFWAEKNLFSFLLLPLSFLYFLGLKTSIFFTKTKKISKPVICVGNIIAGGSGKTPVAIALGKILQEMNISFAYLSRGYMGDDSQFLLLQKEHFDKAHQVGDEPLLLSENATTFIAKNRFFGANQIDKIKKFSAIILDDGMQNNSLHRDFTIMVIDEKIGFGNGFLIPAGPMREKLESGLAKTDLVVIIGKLNKNLEEKISGKSFVEAKIIATNLSDFSGKKLIAFCGIGYPSKFFSFLEKQGIKAIQTFSFSDHYKYTKKDLENLLKIAKGENAQLITTKKDWIKFSSHFQKKISYLNIELEFENKELVKNMLQKIL